MEPVVAADDVSKSYDGTRALDGVSLAVPAGEVFALIGPNGAGKTTLVRCLTGTATPDTGSVSLLGESPRESGRERLGLLPQSFDLPDRLTPRELVAYYAGLYEDARRPADALREVGVDPDTETWYGDLSGGEQRRTAVACALVNDPDVLFVDEPTTGVDPAGRRDLWAVFEDLADAGTTIFLTTHYMAEAERLADTVGLLADGRLVAEGDPESLVAEYGGDSRVVVETDATPEAFADAEFAPRATDDGLVFEDVPATDIGRVVDAFDARGLAFGAVEWREPDLEDVYLALADDATDGRAADGRSPEVVR